jgi:tetratricopeptide (TPR) repeat protein
VEVPVPLLQAIAELSEVAMHDGLRHLQAAEFVYETRLFPEHAYTFKHALTHLFSITVSLGLAYTLSGRVTEVLRLFDQVVVQEDPAIRGSSTMIKLGEAYLLAGRLETAIHLTERALVLARDRKGRGSQAWALRLLGEIALHGSPSDIALAETHYRQALALAKELGMRPLVAHCHAGLGALYAKTGRWEQARTELSAAIALYRVMAMTFWLPQTEAALA